ncbi:MAG: helix-turn-helix domain-containing protein [Lachnospiraceae bacterium]|jgi:carbohydrate diacid regulator|nr:helix-turn-helix domain-containing protein [Lachnospiraceae bacterium]
MLTPQIIKNSLMELKNITKAELCVLEPDGTVVAATYEDDLVDREAVCRFVESPADSQVIGADHLLKIMDEEQLAYVLNAKGQTDDVYMVGRIAVCQLQALLVAYKEKLDRNSFFQNLLLDNLLLIDVYNRARRLHIEAAVPRVVIMVEMGGEKDLTAMELLRGIYSHHGGDYVTAVDEQSIILIKALPPGSSYDEVDKIAHTIVDMMNMEALISVRVGYGTIVGELKDVSKSYKEAAMALEVGRIFYIERTVNAFNRLGIGRLIYQLPVNLCKIFIDEIFRDISPQDIDEETIITVSKFFENSLNVSETARQLFVHRNTLVYRLERLERNTGLDVRVFDDALTFKIAMMVVDYMRYIGTIGL